MCYEDNQAKISDKRWLGNFKVIWNWTKKLSELVNKPRSECEKIQLKEFWG